jgi:hypothetical protein
MKIRFTKAEVGKSRQTMKAFSLFTAIFATTFSSFADSTNSLEKFSPYFSTNTEILWQATTNRLPKSFWTYKRLPPRPFSASVISNAVILASLQDKGFPKPSTNAFFIWSAPNLCGMSFSIFSIQPASTTISFSSPNQNLSTDNVPDDATVTKRAFECAARFGLDQAHLIPKNVYSSSNAAGCEETLTNGICARGIFLSRKLDDVSFFGDAKNGSEGFSIEFGSRGQIRFFSFVWPNLEPDQKGLAASPKEIIRCIREHKVMVLPDDKPNYFGRIKMLAKAKAFTITKIMPCYGEGVFGEVPTNDVPSAFVTPFAELEAIADFGNSNATIRLLSPVISSEVVRLLGNKIK